MEPYYYTHMSKEKQVAYHLMYKGFVEIADEIQMPWLEAKDLQDVFFLLRLDHPEIFWVVSFHYKYYKDSGNLIFIPEYMFKKDKIKEHQSAMKSRVEKLTRPMLQKSELEKEKFVHDFICENITYDKLKKPYSHEIIGPLGHGVGVCEGIAKSVKILCDALNVWCIIVLCDNNPEKKIKYRHTWNVVKIGGEYYHLDATFDNTLTKRGIQDETYRYDYFNIDDKAVFRDHEPLLVKAPACKNADHSYYREKKLSFTKSEDVYNRAKQAAKKGKTLTFHWRGGYLTKEVCKELLDLIEKAGNERDKTAKVSLNWPQAVLRITYVEGVKEAEVEMQEANEGEEE